MATIDQNQQEDKRQATEIIYLHELQPELVAAKVLLAKVLKKVCADDKLMDKIYRYSGDSSTAIIWYLQQVIKYLEAIIANNQILLDALVGRC